MNENPQSVCLEGMTRKPVTIDSLLELAYVQFVISSLAIELFVNSINALIANIGHDKPDVQSTCFRDFHLGYDSLVMSPGVRLVKEFTISFTWSVVLLKIFPHLT